MSAWEGCLNKAAADSGADDGIRILAVLEVPKGSQSRAKRRSQPAERVPRELKASRACKWCVASLSASFKHAAPSNHQSKDGLKKAYVKSANRACSAGMQTQMHVTLDPVGCGQLAMHCRPVREEYLVML